MTNETTSDLAIRMLVEDDAELGEEERHVLENIAAGRLTSRDAADVSDERSSFGERLSDRVAAVGGSWSFIIFFGIVLVGWMLLNTDILAHIGKQFDPYPYIFLNLLLSTLAAIQAPVIMMSQNRQAAKDRVAARLDYETNLRAELDILRLHDKIDRSVDERLIAIEQRVATIAAAVEKRGGSA
ncbi:DUF1003 domain-containing protein [Sphingomonas sp.]|uniref:DUF1003 domain-containing protein n=1 Tax=Sphingomonas sp. TaxID=28214 RepID=UPI0025DA51DB|nr:DUF1003 domain-containing protein [Sphingomonas sp.]